MTPDQELLELLRELNKKLGILDVNISSAKAHMESLERAIENLTDAVEKK